MIPVGLATLTKTYQETCLVDLSGAWEKNLVNSIAPIASDYSAMFGIPRESDTVPHPYELR